ncbi:peptidoglycan-associated lipoprotein Pal [Noviherbaspirillum massiliense]|uniref:peptidoglycan-associated lipoprotein Pal n=1 Tax=Noviherbaspirillum massiliense TaxID=1465823 RepID=UPI00030020D9|nr:peptidoglycan-associated lipoprotein Pal [Noviherbaspirillum massiliense]
MHPSKAFALIAFSAAILSACSSTPVDNKTASASQATQATGTDAQPVATANTAADPLNDPKGALAKRSVYFDFDSYMPKDDANRIAEAHAKYLTTHKSRKIVIEGNTDARGGSEYNLALGQKRAEAVRKSLSALGVGEAQMETVSFGKEKPKALGADEASWAENRRADIVYK